MGVKREEVVKKMEELEERELWYGQRRGERRCRGRRGGGK